MANLVKTSHVAFYTWQTFCCTNEWNGSFVVYLGCLGTKVLPNMVIRGWNLEIRTIHLRFAGMVLQFLVEKLNLR